MVDVDQEVDENVENDEVGEETEGEEGGKEYSGRKIMCFISKKMVPIEDTLEIEYSAGKSYRVLEKFVRYAL